MAVILLRDIMSADPITIQSTLTVQDAVDLMVCHEIRHLVVLTPLGNPIGLVSQRDVFRHLAVASPLSRQWQLRAVMSQPLKWGPPDMPVSQAAHRMLHERIGCLAVIDANKLVGIVTRGDLLSHGSW